MCCHVGQPDKPDLGHESNFVLLSKIPTGQLRFPSNAIYNNDDAEEGLQQVNDVYREKASSLICVPSDLFRNARLLWILQETIKGLA
jgi:hypothetical protein